MGIILFLVDTSASMNQRTFHGTSYLDVAKGAIDTFMKYRSRDPASRGDRYMLVSFDEPPNAVKSGWKENHTTFVHELKNLQATGLSSFGRALKESFSLLNLHRLHNCIDHYGQGRNPFFLEPAVIIALTDSAKLTNQITVEDELTLPMDSQVEGSELTKEPFRWDQRLFTVLLRLPGMGQISSSSNSVEISLTTMSEATGGKCYIATNQKTLIQAMESLTQKLHPGVVVNFQKIGGCSPNSSVGPGSKDISRSNTPVAMEIDNAMQHQRGVSCDRDKETPPSGDRDTTSWHTTRKMIFVKPSTKNNVPTGFWPIPESFWPDSTLSKLPSRDVHPVILFNTVDMPLLLVENFPFDKYELEPSPLTQHILSKKNPQICWQVFIEDSGKDPGITHPFGYLKASTSLAHVTLFVMPFNYAVLLPLISEIQRHGMRPPSKWKQEFMDYLSSLPSYYIQPLRNSLRLMGAPLSLVPDGFDFQLSFTISNYLHKLKKQAKVESERVVSAITQSRTNNISRRSNGIVDLGEGISIAIGSTQEGPTIQSFRNPFDILRSSLLEQVEMMRSNFLHASSSTTPNMIEEVSRHQVPISQMGNYQEHLKRLNPLREVDSGAVRTQLFGNPFKLEKRGSGQDSEISFADEHMVETLGSRRSTGRKRNLRSPSPMPSPRPSKSTPLPSSTLPPSPLPSPSPSPSPHSPTTTNHTQYRSRTLKEKSPEQEAAQTNNHKQLPVSSKEVKPVKVESSKERVNNQTGDTMETEQGRKVKGASTNAKPNTNSNDLRNSLKNNHRRKRERTPSPTSSVPGSKRRANSPTSQSVNSTASDATGQLPNPRTTQPASKPLTGTNNSLKLPGAVRLVKPEMSSASKVLNEEILKQQGQENARLKMLIFKEVKKQGKSYSPQTLFQYLEGVKGSVEVRRGFVQDVIREASKFKRKPLIQQLEEWTDKLPAAFRTVSSSKVKTKSEKR